MSHEINAVNVYSIDEERLRFRVIVAIDADNAGGLGRGSYDITVILFWLILTLESRLLYGSPPLASLQN